MSKKLAFFTTLGASISTWAKIGTLERELAVYQELRQKGWDISIFSFDTKEEYLKLLSLKELEGIQVFANYPSWLPKRFCILYAWLIPFLYYNVGKATLVVKTNQAHSGWHALWASKIWRSKFVARSGYILGEQLTNSKNYTLRNIRKKITEKITFRMCDIAFCPTQKLIDWVSTNYKIKKNKIVLMPNNVDINSFKPNETGRTKNNPPTILTIGRLTALKRLDLLIKAGETQNWQINCIGEGPEEEKLKQLAAQNNTKVSFLGKINNNLLPQYFSNSNIYIICSKYEGHSKSLLEAMACGKVCIGADSPGINNVIIHNSNGLLFNNTSEGLRTAISNVLANGKLYRQLEKGARKFACDNYSLIKLTEKENYILLKLIADKFDG